MLTTDCALPLAEHLCLRGMEWVGHRVFERGYWKNGEEKSKEIEVLDASEDSERKRHRDRQELDSHHSMCRQHCAHCRQLYWVNHIKEWRIEDALSKRF
ncbi:hypothetical protein FIBSPDRAFT_970286 [Athelia psychrophila]|uniref:Uncharacterized protein n=1 Tax=Athelia psychrophila TaxID=1759441 RepID=A0A167SSR4_9AGAM|nr:hypothetical protein FIBSPDRAFT_970286 [Fibularhizoctonia sp. CBS 109695]